MDPDQNNNFFWSGAERRKLLAHDPVSGRVIIASVAIAVTVFSIDVLLPLGVAGGVPYVALILMGIWYPSPRHTYVLAIIATMLTFVGYLESPSGGVLWIVLFNRGLALFAIWITAFLIASRKHFEDALRVAHENLENKVAERTKELKNSEASNRAITESASDAIISADEDGLIIQWNQAAQLMFGYHPLDIVGHPITHIIPDRYQEAHTNGFKRFMARGKGSLVNSRTEMEALRKDGTEFPIEFVLSDWRIDDQIFVTAIIRDISERKQADEEISKLSQTVEQSPNMMFVTDTDGVIEYANEKFYQVTGYAPGEVVGQTPRILKSGNTPQSLYDDLWKTIRAGKIWQGELKDRCKDGTSFWANVTISPLRSRLGDITHYFASHEDITERKEAERKMQEAKEQAVIANRAKSDLMANMSHELRTPLNAIIGFSATMINETFGSVGSEKNREYMDDINLSGLHLLELINDILDVSAIEAGAMDLREECISVSKVTDAAVRLIRPRAEAGQVTVTSSIDPELPHLYSDERRVKQILLNLLSNAVKFTPTGGEVSINAWANDDGSLSIAISDSGIGMDADEVELALSTFGQVDSGLDRKHEGSGLGLPLTVGLMQLHGGSLTIKSAKDRGTLVTVIFPKARVIEDVAKKLEEIQT